MGTGRNSLPGWFDGGNNSTDRLLSTSPPYMIGEALSIIISLSSEAPHSNISETLSKLRYVGTDAIVASPKHVKHVKYSEVRWFVMADVGRPASVHECIYAAACIFIIAMVESTLANSNIHTSPRKR